MKIGLVTVYNGYNYGSKLQAYAIQEVLKSIIGADVEILAYNRATDYRPITLARKIIRKIERLLEGDVKKTSSPYMESFLMRKKIFDSFDKKYSLTEEICGYSKLKEKADIYDIFVCGSDQIWHPDLIVTDFYTLYFVMKKKRTISYAASFGIDSIPQNKVKAYRKFLNQLDIISVREKSGCHIVENLTGKDSTWVLDPTMLLSREMWSDIVKKSNYDKHTNTKYVLCYFLGTNKMHRMFAKSLGEYRNCEVINFPYMRGYNDVDSILEDGAIYDADPLQFVSLIANADYVCTDSFHATVFSVLFNKQFCALKRFSDDASHSTNTRIVSLLDMLDLSERLVDPDEDIYNLRDITEEDFYKAFEKLSEERKKSLVFLKRALYEDNN